MNDNKIAQERWDMAKIMADNFHINGEGWDDSDFEWTAHCLQAAGYHKQSDAVELDKVAEMLRRMFDDDCACNYNDNDEWLTEKCKYAETDCPMPAERLGCWKEFVKHFLAKMDGEER